jgi:DNA-binding FadR family transcriptional regulator
VNRLDISPIQPIARDDAVLKTLAAFVQQEALETGDKLPTERVLSERLKVSRNTVREALTRWEGLGLVERRQGSGTYLKAEVSPDMLHMPLTLAGGSDFEGLMQTLEIRRALEAEAAALCATRATDSDIAGIAEKLEALERVFHETRGMQSDADWEFHQAVYRASGNTLFEQIIAAMQDSFHRFWEHPLGVRDFGHASFPYHRGMFERIAARDAEGARTEALKLIATIEVDLKRGARNLKPAGRR